MFVVGLTGGVGSGKTTVTDLLAHHGLYVIDADVVAREVVAPKSVGLEAIVSHFGRGILTAEGSLDRQGLAQKVFGDDLELAALNAIVHPLVRSAIDSRLDDFRARDDVVLLSVPLLIESGHYGYDRLIVVDLPEEIAVTRVIGQRGWSEEQARARIAVQASRQRRLQAADFVIDNSGSRDALIEQVEVAWRFIEEARSRSAD